MRSTRVQIASWVLLLTCLLVLSSAMSFAADDKAAAKTLTALDDDWSKAAGARDVDRVASFYAEDARAYPPNEPIAVGRAAAREVWARYFAAPDFKISWKTTAAGADGNTGWTAGTYEDSFKDADGKTITEKGKYLCVWKKGADGKWKAIQDMWNSDSK
jgi:ketosteroid isomerase-like protein